MSHPVLQNGMYGIMSGENPHSRPTVEGGHHALHGALSKLGLPFEEVKGHYGAPERSFIIHNISEDAIKKLGKDFGQESVIHSVGGHHKLHYTNGPKAGHYQEGRGLEVFDKPPEDFYTELPGHGYFRLHFQQTAAHPHSYDWHDGHTGHHGGLAKAVNEQHAAVGTSSAYHDIARHFGTVGEAPSNLKFYQLVGKGPDVNNLVRKHGYQTYYAGGKHGQPDLANKNYNTKHLMIYDPEAGSGGDFGETEYTDAWRKVHELGHALTLPELNEKYGEARRMGKLGIHRTPHEAMRAVHWEWLAAHKQRELSKQLGVHVSDADFNRELNTVMHDAVHRAITGKFSDPAQEKFVPHPHKVPLSSSLALVAGAAQKMGLHPHETMKQKAQPPQAQPPVAKAEKPDQLIPRIHRQLTDDLRKNPWKGHENPLAGHCYVASEALYHKLGGQRSGWVPQFVVHENSPHWFLKHRETGEIVDPTASQFRTPIPYHLARGKGFLTKEPSARAQKVLQGLTKAEALNLVPVRGHVSMADTKNEKLYTPEEVRDILLKAARERIAEYAVEIENLRKREGVAKAIIPVHAHNQGTQAGPGIEDIPPVKLTEKAEKCMKCGEMHSGLQKCGEMKTAKAEACAKCKHMHAPMEKCGEMKKDQPSPEYKDSSAPVSGTPNAGEKDLPHDKISEELSKAEKTRAAAVAAQWAATHPVRKNEEPAYGVYLGKTSKCNNPHCSNAKTGTKYCSRACSIAVEDPKLAAKLKADWEAKGKPGASDAQKAEDFAKDPGSKNGNETYHDQGAGKTAPNAGGKNAPEVPGKNDPLADIAKDEDFANDPGSENGNKTYDLKGSGKIAPNAGGKNAPEVPGKLVTGKPTTAPAGSNGKQIQQAGPEGKTAPNAGGVKAPEVKGKNDPLADAPTKKGEEKLEKPPVSEAQRRAMRAAAGGHSTLGIPKKVGKEFSSADPGGKLPEHKKAMPPGLSKATVEKLTRQCKGDMKKAVATAWKIHDEMRKNSTNQFFQNGADTTADAGTVGSSPANAMATSASNQPGVQAGGAGGNMPLGEGNVLNKGEQFVDNQGHVVETGIEPSATLPPQAPAKARSRGVVPQHPSKNGQILRAGEKNGSGGVVLPGASLRRPGRTAGKKGGDVSGNEGMQNRGSITEPSQEGFGDSGPSDNSKTYDKRGEGKASPGPGKAAGDKTYSKRGEGAVAPGAVTKSDKATELVFETPEPKPLHPSDKKKKPVKKGIAEDIASAHAAAPSKPPPLPGATRGIVKNPEVEARKPPSIPPVAKAAGAAVPSAKPPAAGAAPASSSTPKAPAMPKPKTPQVPALAGMAPMGFKMGKGDLKPASAETKAWMKKPSKPEASPLETSVQSVAKHISPMVGRGPGYGPGKFPPPAVEVTKFPKAAAGSTQLPGSHLTSSNPAAPKMTASPGPLKVSAPKAKPGIFGKLGRRK